MRCDNCKKFIINPVEHEYCVFKSKPAPRIEKIVGPVIKPDEYVAPKVQGKLNHQMAPLGAKPPADRLPFFWNKPWRTRKPEPEFSEATYKPGHEPVGIRKRSPNK